MIFLAVMVVGMYRFDPSGLQENERINGVLGFRAGVVMQFINGKEWAFVIIIMSQFIAPMGGGLTGILSIISITLTICFMAMVAWTLAGVRLKRIFSQEISGRRVLRICSSLLALMWIGFLLQGPVNV